MLDRMQGTGSQAAAQRFRGLPDGLGLEDDKLGDCRAGGGCGQCPPREAEPSQLHDQLLDLQVADLQLKLIQLVLIFSLPALTRLLLPYNMYHFKTVNYKANSQNQLPKPTHKVNSRFITTSLIIGIPLITHILSISIGSLFIQLVAALVIVVANHHHLFTIVISVLEFQLLQLWRFLLVLEPAFVVQLPGLAEIMEFVIVLQTYDVLVLILVVLEEEEFGVWARPLSRSGHIFKQLPRNIDIVFYLISYAPYHRFPQVGIHVPPALLHIAKFVHLVYRIRQQLLVEAKSLVQFAQGKSRLHGRRMANHHLHLFVLERHQQRHLVGVFRSVAHQSFDRDPYYLEETGFQFFHIVQNGVLTVFQTKFIPRAGNRLLLYQGVDQLVLQLPGPNALVLQTLVQESTWTAQHFSLDSLLRFVLPVEFHRPNSPAKTELDSNVYLHSHLFEDRDAAQIECHFHEFPESKILVILKFELCTCEDRIQGSHLRVGKRFNVSFAVINQKLLKLPKCFVEEGCSHVPVPFLIDLIDSFLGLPNHLFELVHPESFFAVGLGSQSFLLILDLLLLGCEHRRRSLGEEVVFSILGFPGLRLFQVLLRLSFHIFKYFSKFLPLLSIENGVLPVGLLFLLLFLHPKFLHLL